VRSAAALLAVLLVSTAWAQQSTPEVSQAHVPLAPRAAAQAPPQIAAPSKQNRTMVQQLPAGLKEQDTRATNLHRRTSPPLQAEVSAPARRNPASVNADEIARLLNDGQASSIDAAAAIASGLAPAPEADVPEEPSLNEKGAPPEQ
jgi:hypothetical protein